VVCRRFYSSQQGSETAHVDSVSVFSVRPDEVGFPSVIIKHLFKTINTCKFIFRKDLLC
jgi:hypothetical protein